MEVTKDTKLMKKSTLADVSKMADVPVEMLIQGLEETIAKLEAEKQDQDVLLLL